MSSVRRAGPVRPPRPRRDARTWGNTSAPRRACRTRRGAAARRREPRVSASRPGAGVRLALRGELVSQANRPLAVRLRANHALCLEALQAIREDVRGDAGDAGL